jgi:hypothetical protein
MENQIFLNREIVSLMPRAGLQNLLPEKKTLVLSCANAASRGKRQNQNTQHGSHRSSAISAGSIK